MAFGAPLCGMVRSSLLLLLLLSACDAGTPALDASRIDAPVDVPRVDAPEGLDAPVLDAPLDAGRDAPVLDVPPDAPNCGDQVCPRGTVCCEAACSLCAPPDACVACPDPDLTPDGGVACRSNADCGANERCDFGGTAACLASPGPVGLCVAIPEICSPVLATICGCDGVTYENPCSAPVDFAYAGPCRD